MASGFAGLWDEFDALEGDPFVAGEAPHLGAPVGREQQRGGFAVDENRGTSSGGEDPRAPLGAGEAAGSGERAF